MVASILNGLSGLISGVLFIAGPDGHFLQAGALRPVIETLPLASVFFRDFTWIGVAMLLALCIPNTVAAAMLLRRSERQYVATLACGMLLLLWTGFEIVYMFSIAALGYFTAGVISVLASIWLLRLPQGAAGECLTSASTRLAQRSHAKRGASLARYAQHVGHTGAADADCGQRLAIGG